MSPAHYTAMLALYAQVQAQQVLTLACSMLEEKWSFAAGLLAADAALSILLPKGL